MQWIKVCMIMLSLTLLASAEHNISKSEQKKLDRASKVKPLSKTKFWVTRDSGESYEMDLLGKNFIVVSLREKGADGLIYAVDKEGLVWWAENISSGAMGNERLQVSILCYLKNMSICQSRIQALRAEII